MILNAQSTGSDIAIDLTPVIDMVFNLLIFFLVATSFQQLEREMKIALPHAASAGPISAMLKEIVEQQAGTGDARRREAWREIETLVDYVKAKLAGVLDVAGSLEPREVTSEYDVAAWLAGADRLLDRASPHPVTYVFEYDDDQITARRDYFRRYGTDANALSKIVTRVSNVESLFRRRRTVDGSCAPESDEAKQDLFIRYTLSR